MAFVGNIFGAYAARATGQFNQSLLYQEAQLARKNAAIKQQAFQNIELPRLLKQQERDQSSLLVNLLKSGVDVDRVGETPYLLMLDQNIENAYDVSIANYNSRVTYQNEINRSLLTEARGRGEAFKGELAFRTGLAKAGGDIYTNREEYGSLLG
tara:strand:- start:2607 stop:3068 length:462 start_codon:yes stop_codon:yes gene_type:complete